MKRYFELNKKYQFDPTDLTALIYTFCAVLGSMGVNVSLLFLIGSLISTAFCWQGRRINLIVLNASLLVFNIVSFLTPFIK